MTRSMIKEVKYAYPTYICHFLNAGASSLSAANDIGQVQPQMIILRGDSRFCAS